MCIQSEADCHDKKKKCLQVGTYDYRMTAWNALGWSDYGHLNGCNTANASLPCPPSKCWNKAGCSQALSTGAEESDAAMEGVSIWKLLCSLGGIAVVSLAISARYLGSNQHSAVQVYPFENKSACPKPATTISGGMRNHLMPWLGPLAALLQGLVICSSVDNRLMSRAGCISFGFLL